MPLSDPYSSYLDRLARQRAEDELMRSRLGEASKQLQGGLGQWNEALRVQKADTRQTEQDTAAAAERSEGLRLRKAQDAREAERAKREADEAARIAAQRPIEEARATEDRAFTLRQRETSTADAARKAAIEKIKALPPETMMGEGVDVRGFIVQTGAAGGLTPDEALGLYRDAQTARANAEDATALDVRMKEAQIKKAGRAGTGGGASAGRDGGVKPDISIVNKVADYDAQLSMLEGIAEKKKSVNTGILATPMQSLAEKFGMAPQEFTTLKADTANVINSIIAALSGANVPPAEMARLLNGLPDPSDDDNVFMTKLESKIRELRTAKRYLIGAAGAAGRNVSGMGIEPSTAPAAGLPSADEFFGG